MKKLYRKGTVHPSPPIVSDHLAFLPATILTLAAALSPDDREVLAYLISSAANNFSSSSRRTGTAAAAKKAAAVTKGSGSCGVGGDHPARFNCNCFRCYTSFWVRWDESPNRQLIHEIIDAFEDGLPAESKSGHSNSKFNNSKKDRRNKRGIKNGSDELNRPELSLIKKELLTADRQEAGGGANGDGGEVDGEESEKGSVRRFVSFLGERIWGVWSTKDED